MKLVIYPPVDAERLRANRGGGGADAGGQCRHARGRREAIVEADAFFGKLTPPLLAAATRLRWVQSPTASLEHYLFPELVEHPCQLTNMRGLFSDVIAEHVLGVMLCFTRNLHRYIRNQVGGLWAPVGGEHERGRPLPPDRAWPTPSIGPTRTWAT